MKTQESIHINSIRRLLLMVPVICSLTFAACSDLAGTAGTHTAGNLQSAVVREPHTRDNVIVGPTTYNSQIKGFQRAWPIAFGI
jgi:hypothetical protein